MTRTAVSDAMSPVPPDSASGGAGHSGPPRCSDCTVEHPSRRSRARWRMIGVLLGLVGLLGSVVFAGPVSAAPHSAVDGPGPPEPLADGFAGPLSIDVNWRGTVLVGQSFSGTASEMSRKGAVRDLFNTPGLGPVAYGPFGTVIYATVTGGDEEPPAPGDQPTVPDALLNVRLPNGHTFQLADLGAFEEEHDPDGDVLYGVHDLTDECAAQWPVEQIGPPEYTGDVNPNPYALAVTPWGVYVADAGANTLMLVTWWGTIHVVTLFGPQPLEITADFADANGVPDCAVGHTYYTNAVPTDIEVTPRGGYVSLLPGGPEDPSAGARGTVMRVNLRSGHASALSTGFLGATDLAVSPRGQVYVTELFGGRVSRLTPGGPVTVAEFDQPVAVEWQRGSLYVAHGAFGNGTVSSLRP